MALPNNNNSSSSSSDSISNNGSSSLPSITSDSNNSSSDSINANVDDHGVNWCQRICRNRTCHKITLLTSIFLFFVIIGVLIGTGVLKSGYIHIKEIGLQKVPEVNLDTYKDGVVAVKTKFFYHISFEKKVKVKPYLDLVTYDFGLYDWTTDSSYCHISTYTSKYKVLKKEQTITVNFEANLTHFTNEEQKEIKDVIDGGRAMMVFSGNFKWHVARDRFLMMVPYKNMYFTCLFPYTPNSSYVIDHNECNDFR